MQLRNQVCSLELAKKLKTLRVKQESLWYWRITAGHPMLIINSNVPDEYKDKYYYSAFTVAEFGEILSTFYLTWKNEIENLWICRHLEDFSGDNLQTADTEANARAKMKIYLLENKFMPKEQ